MSCEGIIAPPKEIFFALDVTPCNAVQLRAMSVFLDTSERQTLISRGGYAAIQFARIAARINRLVSHCVVLRFSPHAPLPPPVPRAGIKECVSLG